MKRLQNYIKTLKAECSITRGDIDEDLICQKVIARLESVDSIKELKHYAETLKLRMDESRNGHEFSFYKDVKNKIKDIIKREKK